MEICHCLSLNRLYTKNTFVQYFTNNTPQVLAALSPFVLLILQTLTYSVLYHKAATHLNFNYMITFHFGSLAGQIFHFNSLPSLSLCEFDNVLFTGDIHH